MDEPTEKFALYHSLCVLDDAELQRNCDANLARGYDECRRLPERTGRLAACGSGPSLRDHIEELREFDEVWAINGAYDYLVAHGIVPTGFLGVDPIPGLLEYVERANPKTTFYLSVLCDPSVLAAVAQLGCPVKMWFPNHPGLKYGKGHFLISGGTTVLTCAPFIGKLLGWNDITIFGADSSFSREGRYAYPDNTYVEDSNRPVNWVVCNGEGPFPTEALLCRQVATLGVYHMLPDIDLKFRCGGLMDAFLRAPMHEFPSNGEIINLEPPPRPDTAKAGRTQR